MSIGDFPESLSQAMLVGIMLVGGLGVCLRPVAGACPVGDDYTSYEQFARLAETRLARNSSN